MPAGSVHSAWLLLRRIKHIAAQDVLGSGGDGGAFVPALMAEKQGHAGGWGDAADYLFSYAVDIAVVAELGRSPFVIVVEVHQVRELTGLPRLAGRGSIFVAFELLPRHVAIDPQARVDTTRNLFIQFRQKRADALPHLLGQRFVLKVDAIVVANVRHHLRPLGSPHRSRRKAERFDLRNNLHALVPAEEARDSEDVLVDLRAFAGHLGWRLKMGRSRAGGVCF